MKVLGTDIEKQQCSFCISVVLRDNKGNPVGRKEFESNDGNKILDFYHKNSGVARHKKKKK